MEAFFYGCNYREDPLKTRIFPYLLSKINSKISFAESRFSMDNYKESTARITLWKELRAPNVFCLEASFYGYKKDIQNDQNKQNQQNNLVKDKQGTLAQILQKENKDLLLNPKFNNENQPAKKNVHFTIQDYLDIGRDICLNLYNLMYQEAANKESKGAFVIDSGSLLHNQLQEIAENKDLLESGNKSDSGSDSNPSEDDLDDEEMLDIIPKNALSKKQKQILNDRLKKEKNDKNGKKVKNPIIQEQPNNQQQLEAKRKQTNQMYLQRYLQKQQEKLANSKGKTVQKKDQDQQTDASFLYDLFLYMEKKRQLLQTSTQEQEQQKSNSPQHSPIQEPILSQQPSTFQIQSQHQQPAQQQITQSQQTLSQQASQQKSSFLQSNTEQNINQISNSNSQNSIPLSSNNSHNIINNIKENNTSLNNNIYNKTLSTTNILPSLGQSSQPVKPVSSQNQNVSPLVEKLQGSSEENQSTSILKDRSAQKYQGIKKGGTHYSFHSQRVKSLDQGIKNSPIPPNVKLPQQQQGALTQNIIAYSDIKSKAEIQRGQQSQRLIQRQPLPINNSNFINSLATVSENQGNEDKVMTEQSPILLGKNNELGLERKRDTSMSFSYANPTNLANINNTNSIMKSNYGPLDHKFIENNRYENLRNNNPNFNSRLSGVSNHEQRNNSNTTIKQSVDLSSIKKTESKKEGNEQAKIKILYSQKRNEPQYFNSVDFSQLQSNAQLKQQIFSNLEKNDNRPNMNVIQSQQPPGLVQVASELINTQKQYDLGQTSSFLPQIGSPKQQINFNNQGNMRYQNDQIIQQFQNTQSSSFGKQQNNSNNINNAINIGMLNSYKSNNNPFLINQSSAMKANFQPQPKDAFMKSQSVQLLLKSKQNISTKQKI